MGENDVIGEGVVPSSPCAVVDFDHYQGHVYKETIYSERPLTNNTGNVLMYEGHGFSACLQRTQFVLGAEGEFQFSESKR